MAKVLPTAVPTNPAGLLVVTPQASAVDVGVAVADGSSKTLGAVVGSGSGAAVAAKGGVTAASVPTAVMAGGAAALITVVAVVAVVATGGSDAAPTPPPTPSFLPKLRDTPPPAPGLWTGCANHNASALAIAQSISFPRSVAIGAATLLPRSLAGQLLTLRRIAGSSGVCPSAVVARSYDGHAWEGVQPVPLQPMCTAATGGGHDCAIAVAAGAVVCVVGASAPVGPCSYRVDAAARGAVGGGDDALITRLLTQATFGPTRATLAAFKAAHGAGAGAAAAWVAAQQALPVASLRAYYRARANPRITAPTMAGGVVSACEAGSRWHRYAFTVRAHTST